MQSNVIRLAVLILFTSSIGWGLTWLPIKALNELGLDSLHLIFFAFISASVVVSPWLYRQRAEWKTSLRLMLMIALAGAFANVSFQTAIFHGEVIRVMILFYMLPVWSVVGGWLFLKEKIDTIRIIAVMLCLSGAFIILDVWHTSWQGVSWIDLLAVGSGMGLAATNILFRYAQSIPVVSKVAATFIGCTIMTGIMLAVSTSSVVIPDNGAVTYAMLYGAIWLTLVTFGTQWGVTQLEAGRSAIIIVMELVAAVVSAALLTSANLGVNEVVGGFMVLGAAMLEGMRSDEVEVSGLPIRENT